MPAADWYITLESQAKYVLNIIKMICYRSETSFALRLGQGYAKSLNENRALAKALIASPVDMEIDPKTR